MTIFRLIPILLVLALWGCGDSQDDGVDTVNPSGSNGANENNDTSGGTGNPPGDSQDNTQPGDGSNEMSTNMDGNDPIDDSNDMNQPADLICPEGQDAVDGVCIPTDLDSGGLAPELVERLVGTYAVQIIGHRNVLHDLVISPIQTLLSDGFFSVFS